MSLYDKELTAMREILAPALEAGDKFSNLIKWGGGPTGALDRILSLLKFLYEDCAPFRPGQLAFICEELDTDNGWKPYEKFLQWGQEVEVIKCDVTFNKGKGRWTALVCPSHPENKDRSQFCLWADELMPIKFKTVNLKAKPWSDGD